MRTHLQEGVRGGLFSWVVPPLGNPSCEVNTNAGNWEVLQWVTGRDEEPVVLVSLCWLTTSSSTWQGQGGCMEAPGGLGISSQHPRVLGPPCPRPTLQGQCGGVLTELCEADGPCLQSWGIAQRQVKKRCLLLWERDTDREKIHHGASSWDFDACGADSAALTSPGCRVLVVQGLLCGEGPGCPLAPLPWLEVWAEMLLGSMSPIFSWFSRWFNLCFCKTPTLSKSDFCLKLHIWRSSSRMGTRLIPFLFSPVKQWEHSLQCCGWAMLSVFGAIKATCLKCTSFKCQMWEELGHEKTIRVNILKSGFYSIAWIFNIKCIIYYKV